MHVSDGDLVMYDGYLAEVIRAPRSLLDGVVIEVTDTGGRARSFVVPKYELRPAGGVLDIMATVRTEIDPRTSSSAQIGEVWMADPQSGDVWGIPGKYVVEIVEIRGTGEVLVKKGMDPGAQFPAEGAEELFTSVKAFQRAHDRPLSPGYTVIAMGTARPEYQAMYPVRTRWK